MNELYYLTQGKKIHLFYFENKQIVEYIGYTNKESSWVGSIIKGRVERYLSGMGAAFVDIGLERNGFLPLLKDEAGRTSPLQSGKEIIVQVKRDPVKEKGALISEEIALAGKYLMYIPGKHWVGISKRIKDQSEKRYLKDLGYSIIDKDEGVVMRKAALFAKSKELIEEKNTLKEKWQKIKASSNKTNGPAMIYKGDTPLTELLRDYGPKHINKIITNEKDFKPEGFFVEWNEKALELLPNFFKKIEKTTKKKIELANDGSIVFDFCEAFTVIDVNTGKFVGRKNQESTILATNLEACEEIARQLRLRNIGGIILIDFIDMEKIENKERVQGKLANALAKDRVKTVIHGFTSLGIMEITRKRTRNHLIDTITPN